MSPTLAVVLHCCSRSSTYSPHTVGSVASSYVWLPLETKGEAPSARWRHSASVVQNCKGEPVPAPVGVMTSLTVLLFIGEDILVVLGGRNTRGEALSDCHQLQLPSLTWSKVEQHCTERHLLWYTVCMHLSGTLCILLCCPLLPCSSPLTPSLLPLSLPFPNDSPPTLPRPPVLLSTHIPTECQSWCLPQPLC